ncbi:hypothetical protein [Natronobacterium gregoryi]|uniref:Uncharacterized protein n=2 Tax=Natronobacterium gregoryi TaxID=44930 RepID=L0AKE2_NATGS|nr:hypothetical protein [Natronobacterium gregoryi]AFZ73525.1 hypothetical protein Natgr_2353 [Natronobacterium gregoryi SP2]ELY68381.1 hypothetical protein C490_09913 [Natronobacterium gregoryi SP2]PLK20572.1 hypothetical protein CYV19_09015 [Natronobacterium gregoryi SP2]SFJ16891.1 hypothetical protein SAMN05443661_11628 [Natronobacterium gregoryi]
MLSRRLLTRNALALVGGGLFSSTAATATTSQAAPPNGQYDASAVSDAPTTAVATVDPSVLETIDLPVPFDSMMADAGVQSDAISIENFESVTASTALEGDAVDGGCAVAVGSFDEQSVESELRGHELEFVARDGRRLGDGVARFVASNDPYAVAVGPSSLRIGYGRTRARARRHLETTLEKRRRRPQATASYGSLPSLLDGHAVAYADLGSETRQLLVDRLPDGSDALAATLGAARAIGVGLRAGSTQARLRYGLVVEPARFSTESLETLVEEATTGENALASSNIYRSGTTVVVDAAVETGSLWPAHERLFDGSA